MMRITGELSLLGGALNTRYNVLHEAHQSWSREDLRTLGCPPQLTVNRRTVAADKDDAGLVLLCFLKINAAKRAVQHKTAPSTADPDRGRKATPPVGVGASLPLISVR